jgi:hypothetical protein
MTPAVATPQFVEESHSYYVQGVKLPSVTQIIDEMGFVDKQWFTKESRERGSAVHAATHFIDEGDMDWDHFRKHNGHLVGYLEAWDRYKMESRFEAVVIEEPMASACLRFAGTPDRFGFIAKMMQGPLGAADNGRDRRPTVRNTLIDIKSGVPDKAHIVQLGGYIDLIEGNGWGSVHDALVVHLQANGKYKLGPVDVAEAKALWRATISIYTHFKGGR